MMTRGEIDVDEKGFAMDVEDQIGDARKGCNRPGVDNSRER
jgi:hypothetical protein